MNIITLFLLLFTFIFWFIYESYMLFRDINRIDRSKDENSISILLFFVLLIILVWILSLYFKIFPFSLYGDGLIFLGILIIWVGILFRLIAVISLGKYFKTIVSIGKNQKLIKTGIYRYIRHPSYTGSLISFLGLGIASGSYFSLFLTLLFSFLGYYKRIKVEEDLLLFYFGKEYEEYMKKTKKLIPFVY